MLSGWRALKEAAEKGIAEVNYSLELASGTHYFEAHRGQKREKTVQATMFLSLWPETSPTALKLN
jgi:hypothetical protein